MDTKIKIKSKKTAIFRNKSGKLKQNTKSCQQLLKKENYSIKRDDGMI